MSDEREQALIAWEERTSQPWSLPPTVEAWASDIRIAFRDGYDAARAAEPDGLREALEAIVALDKHNNVQFLMAQTARRALGVADKLQPNPTANVANATEHLQSRTLGRPAQLDLTLPSVSLFRETLVGLIDAMPAVVFASDDKEREMLAKSVVLTVIRNAPPLGVADRPTEHEQHFADGFDKEGCNECLDAADVANEAEAKCCQPTGKAAPFNLVSPEDCCRGS